MKWKDLDAQERYRAVMMLIRGEATVAELSRTFNVSRQSISRAREQVEQASLAALEPKVRGRKAKSEEQRQIEALQQQQDQLRQELAQEKKKVEIAQAFLDLERTLGRGEAPEPTGKKKEPGQTPSACSPEQEEACERPASPWDCNKGGRTE